MHGSSSSGFGTTPTLTTSICAWLEQTDTPPISRKRRLPGDKYPSAPSKRIQRFPLGEIANNTMHTTPTAQRFRTQEKPPVHQRPHTLRRSARTKDIEQQWHTSSDSNIGVVLDDDATPRRPAVLHPTIESVSDSSSTRSRSPTKMAALKNMAKGFEYSLVSYNDVQRDQNHSLHDIAKFIGRTEDLLQGSGVISSAHRDECLASDPHEFRFPHVFDNDGEMQRVSFGSSPDVDSALKIWRKSVRFETDQEPEAAWNCGVHYPLADMAAELSHHSHSVELKNITTAKIQPKALSPTRISGARLQSKMVDFAYVLTPTETTEAGFRNLDVQGDAPSESYNQTCQNTVVNKPIIISIETKSGATSADNSLPQLVIWAHAQYSKLRQLVDQSRSRPAAGSELAVVSLPPLLLMTAYGPSWSVLIASQDARKKLTLYRLPGAVSTSKKLGVYQAVAVLQLMIQQAVQTYQPWFEAHCVPLNP